MARWRTVAAAALVLGGAAGCSGDDGSSTATTVTAAVPVGSCPLDAPHVSDTLEVDMVLRADCDFVAADREDPTRLTLTIEPFDGEPSTIATTRAALEDAFGSADDLTLGDDAFVVRSGIVSQLLVFVDRIEYRFVLTAPDLDDDESRDRLRDLFDLATDE
jgi:hypothetical protein